MKEILLAGAGGFVGSALRFMVVRWTATAASTGGFPWGTLLVNAAGCFAIGALFRAAEAHQWQEEARWFVFTGLLGGFTTYSAFGLETMLLFREGRGALACANIAAHFVLALGAVWAGYWTARAF